MSRGQLRREDFTGDQFDKLSSFLLNIQQSCKVWKTADMCIVAYKPEPVLCRIQPCLKESMIPETSGNVCKSHVQKNSKPALLMVCP